MEKYGDFTLSGEGRRKIVERSPVEIAVAEAADSTTFDKKITAIYVAERAKNCVFEGPISARYVGERAEGCTFADIKGECVLERAKNCIVEGKIGAIYFLEGSENCTAGGEILAPEGGVGEESRGTILGGKITARWVLERAEKALVAGSVKCECLGEGSLGVVVVGKVEGIEGAVEISPSVFVIKPSEIEAEERKRLMALLEEEMGKAREGGESLFDYLMFFHPPSPTVEGLTSLRELYDQLKNQGILEKLARLPDTERREILIEMWKTTSSNEGRIRYLQENLSQQQENLPQQ